MLAQYSSGPSAAHFSSFLSPFYLLLLLLVSRSVFARLCVYTYERRRRRTGSPVVFLRAHSRDVLSLSPLRVFFPAHAEIYVPDMLSPPSYIPLYSTLQVIYIYISHTHARLIRVENGEFEVRSPRDRSCC